MNDSPHAELHPVFVSPFRVEDFCCRVSGRNSAEEELPSCKDRRSCWECDALRKEEVAAAVEVGDYDDGGDAGSENVPPPVEQLEQLHNQ